MDLKPVAPAVFLPACGLIAIAAGIALWSFAPSLDRTIFDALKLGIDSRWAAPLRGFTTLGGLAVLGPLALAAVAFLVWRGRNGTALWLFLTVGGGRLAVEGTKILLARPRPPVPDRLADVTSYSFPSSHSAGSMMTWLAFAMLFRIAGRDMIVPAILLGCTIGWSRIALGVHWPSDVIAGLGFGMLWVGVARRWLPAG